MTTERAIRNIYATQYRTARRNRTIRNIIFAAAVGVVFIIALCVASDLLYVIKHWPRI